LKFHSDPHFIASLEGPHFGVNFFKGSLPVHAKGSRGRRGEILGPKERLRLLFFLYNFAGNSPRLANLLDAWEKAELQIREKAV
jgi:hypothetical protein